MRWALGIEYMGQNYAGFQRQSGNPAVKTIQGELEQAISSIADEEVSLVCAGRTDAGVNATGQVIHFDIQKERDERSLILGVNTKLPPDIAVTWAQRVDDGFHARFSARSRRYRYILQNTLHRNGILSRGVSIYRGNYDEAAMQDASEVLIGEHDFASFKGADDASRSSCRCVHFIKITRAGPYLIFDIAANAFLNHMVRNIVGSLLLIGSGKRDKLWLFDVLYACSREAAGPMAAPDGLYLVDVTYDGAFNLPKRPYLGPLWLE